MKFVDKAISLKKLEQMAKAKFGDLVKAVVDVKVGVMVIDAELHADEEARLLSEGYKQENLWGINLYPEFFGTDDFVEYDSMINVRPNQNNNSRGIEDKKIREKILKIVDRLVKK